MTLSKSILGSAFSASLGLALCGAAAAEPVFPPPHLHAEARFAVGASNGERIAPPWYDTADAERKLRLSAQEIRQPSPYPSMYYFYTIRGYANDESLNLARLRNQALTESTEGTSGVL